MVLSILFCVFMTSFEATLANMTYVGQNSAVYQDNRGFAPTLRHLFLLHGKCDEGPNPLMWGLCCGINGVRLDEANH